MILTAHQPAYLPWLGLFHKIAVADRFVSLDNVPRSHGDWTNRNRVKTANGPVMLTVPALTHGHRDKPIREIEIDNKQPWQRKHWKTIQQAYGKAPYFKDYATFFETAYSMEWRRLTDLNEWMLQWFLYTLGIRVGFAHACLHDFTGQGSDLLLDMCQNLGANTFIFGEQGRNYADEAAFRAAGIRVGFQKYRHPEYPQQYPGQGFVSHLSIIDLLFNCGPKSYEILMSGNVQPEELRQ